MRIGRGIIQYRQLVQRGQTQIIQKLPRGRKQCWTADCFPMADHLHPATILQLLDDQAVDGHAPYVFDVATRHRLPISNDGQGFESRPRVPGRLLRMESIQVFTHFGTALKAPTGSHLHQFHAPLRPVSLQVLQQHLQSIRPQRVIEEHPQLTQGHRLRRTNQGCLKDPLGIHRIHGSAIPGKKHACYGDLRMAEIGWERWKRAVGTTTLSPAGYRLRALHGSHDPVDGL